MATKRTPTVKSRKSTRAVEKKIVKPATAQRASRSRPARVPLPPPVRPEDLKTTTQKGWGANLKPMERQFVLEYIGCYNGSEAARRAGYIGAVGALACEMLKKPSIAAAVVAAIEEREQRTQITSDRVLQEVHAMAFVDVADLYGPNGCLLPLHEMPPAARRAIVSIETEETFDGHGKERKWTGYVKRVKLASKESMVALAGKHLAMFQDRVKVEGDMSVTVVTGVPEPKKDGEE